MCFFTACIIIVYSCIYIFELFCFDCLPTMNFCGHITKWTNYIMSKPARPHLDIKRPLTGNRGLIKRMHLANYLSMRSAFLPFVDAPLYNNHCFSSGILRVSGFLPPREAPGTSSGLVSRHSTPLFMHFRRRFYSTRCPLHCKNEGVMATPKSGVKCLCL